MKDKLTLAYDLLVDVLRATPFSCKDTGGNGYTVHRDGNITYAEPLADDARRCDATWEAFAYEVSVEEVLEAVRELLDNSIAEDATRMFEDRFRALKKRVQ